MIGKTELPATFRSIPSDLIPNILAYLPHKSLCRFMSVSKSFNSVISDHCFLTTVQSTSSTNSDESVLTVSSAVSYHPRIHLDRFRLFYHQPDRSIILPVLKLVKPRLASLLYSVSFFGQEKILRLSFLKLGTRTSLHCHVWLVGTSSSSWKMIRRTRLHFPVSESCVCVDGILYYQAEICYEDSKETEGWLVAFNIEGETFGFVQMPPPCDDLRLVGGHWNPCLMQFNGRLALIDSWKCPSSLDMWMLKDPANAEWIRTSIVLYKSRMT